MIGKMLKEKNIQSEVDASFLYLKLSENESDPTISRVFKQMSEIETGHALAFSKNWKGSEFKLPDPSFRATALNWIGKVFGYDYVLGVLMDIEKNISRATMANKAIKDIPFNGSEANHVKIIRALLENESGAGGNAFSKFERRHRSVGGNALRAGVLGGNDGLVSNFSLVMGIAGATHGQSGVLLAGLAGLLAGALSMALGEWISVKSSQELYENQMQLEMEEIENDPEGETKELSLIYVAKGIPEEQAVELAEEVMKDKSLAHQILVKEELGINTDELEGSAWEAAIFSFVLFAIGAVLPVIPFMFSNGINAIILSTIISGLGLFLIGAAITLFTGKSILYSGFRQVFFGLTAAAITYGIGRMIGVSIAG